VGIYSGKKPLKAWERESQESIENKIKALKSPVLCEKPNGPATVETYTVLHNSPYMVLQDTFDGIFVPIIIARLDSGQRCFATTKKRQRF